MSIKITLNVSLTIVQNEQVSITEYANISSPNKAISKSYHVINLAKSQIGGGVNLRFTGNTEASRRVSTYRGVTNRGRLADSFQEWYYCINIDHVKLSCIQYWRYAQVYLNCFLFLLFFLSFFFSTVQKYVDLLFLASHWCNSRR